MWPFKRKKEWSLLRTHFGPKRQLNEYTSCNPIMNYWYDEYNREFSISCSGYAHMKIVGKVPNDITNVLEFIDNEVRDNIWFYMLKEIK